MELGQQTIYVVTVRNESNEVFNNVVLCNNIPKEMKFISAQSSRNLNYIFDKDTNTITFSSVFKLKSREKSQYKIICEAIKEGSAKNIAKARHKEYQKYMFDEEGTSIHK